MLLVDLNGQWQMKRTDGSSWIDAKVPGSVYSDLLTAELMEDPFYRDNEYKILELSNYDYEYTRNFIVRQDTLIHDEIMLLCKGLDTLSEVFLNGTCIATTNNMHRIYKIDVKDILVLGENTIRVLFKSPVRYVTQKQAENPLQNVGEAVIGISHLRKSHCMFGWDWGPKLPDMGIWRNISIEGYDYGKIEDVYITQAHTTSKVSLDVGVTLCLFCQSELEILVRIETPEGEILQKRISTKKEEEHILLSIQNPLLWWPNNFGDHPLYTVSICLLKNNKTLDQKVMQIGLRTLTVKQEKDQWGESFAYEINGITIFAMGADYIPEDSILSHCSRERTERLIKDCVDANFNAIRVWGGAHYPEDYFYELCDKHGLIVWQDLMYACGNYDLNEEFEETIRQETIDNMRRIRHHASLGLWCGNNEQEWAWADWGWKDRYSEKLKNDYLKHFEEILPSIAKEIDPNTFYWLASPSSTGGMDKPNDENYGDMHFWDVWHGKEPFTAYRKIHPRFMSEFGLQSFPCLKTVKTFTQPEDLDIFSHVMQSHQKGGVSGNEKILHYISENYTQPKDFDALLFVSQLNQAEALKYGVEHWRRNRGRCMGAVYWQLNDCWPVASWASIDYFGRWKALHYAAKRFFSPLLISACEENTVVSLHVSNETLKPAIGTILWGLRNANSVLLESGEQQIQIEALTSKKFVDLEFSHFLDSEDKKREAYLEYSFIVENQPVTSGTVLFSKAKNFNFIDPHIEINVSEQKDTFIIEISSKAYARFVELDLQDCDGVFSDNYFDLTAGRMQKILLDKSRISKELTLDEFKEQLKVRSLYDTFI